MPTEMQGYLEKGRFFTNTRYFMLKDNSLAYADSPQSPVKVVLNLSNAQIRFDDKGSAVIISGEKVHPARDRSEYYLVAKPKTLYFQWKVALRTVRDSNFYYNANSSSTSGEKGGSNNGTSGQSGQGSSSQSGNSGCLLNFPDQSEFNSLLIDGYRSCLRDAVEKCLMENSEFAQSPTNTSSNGDYFSLSAPSAGGSTRGGGEASSSSAASSSSLGSLTLAPASLKDVRAHEYMSVQMVSNLGNTFSAARYVPSEAALNELWNAHAIDDKRAINAVQHECIFSQMLTEMQSTVPKIVEDIVCVVLRSNGIVDAERHAKVITLNSDESIAGLVYQYSHQSTKIKDAASNFWKILDPRDTGKCAKDDFVTVYQTFPLVPQRDLVDITADEIASQISRLVQSPSRPRGLPMCGLQNLGNTCYFNSVMQTLMHFPKLRQYVLLQKFEDAATPSSGAAAAKKSNNSSSSSTTSFNKPGDITFCQQFHALLVNAGSTSAQAISPYKMRAVFNKKTNNFFAGTQQHDAHEVLNACLDIIHEELNEGESQKWKQLPDIVTPQRSAFDLSQIWWDSHLQQNRSIIQRLFHGQCSCTTRCLNCGHTTMSFDPFSNLILPIPSLATEQNFVSPVLSPGAAPPVDPFASVFDAAAAQQSSADNRSNDSGLTTTLDHCMAAFCAAETLPDFKCEKCKTSSSKNKGAVKRTQLARPPFYLVVYLKRFSHDVLGRLVQKNKTPVAYPTFWNITKYVDESMQSNVLVQNHLERCESVDFVAQMCGGTKTTASSMATTPRHQRSSSWDVPVLTAQHRKRTDGNNGGRQYAPERKSSWPSSSTASSSSGAKVPSNSVGVGGTAQSTQAAMGDIGEYELVATIEHIGRINYGHYMTTIKNLDAAACSRQHSPHCDSGANSNINSNDGRCDWYKCNDSLVSGLGEGWHQKGEARESAYVLVYRLKPPQLA